MTIQEHLNTLEINIKKDLRKRTTVAIKKHSEEQKRLKQTKRNFKEDYKKLKELKRNENLNTLNSAMQDISSNVDRTHFKIMDNKILLSCYHTILNRIDNKENSHAGLKKYHYFWQPYKQENKSCLTTYEYSNTMNKILNSFSLPNYKIYILVKNRYMIEEKEFFQEKETLNNLYIKHDITIQFKKDSFELSSLAEEQFKDFGIKEEDIILFSNDKSDIDKKYKSLINIFLNQEVIKKATKCFKDINNINNKKEREFKKMKEELDKKYELELTNMMINKNELIKEGMKAI